VRAAAETEDVDLVPFVVVLHQPAVADSHVGLEAEAEAAPRDAIQRPSADSFVIEDALCRGGTVDAGGAFDCGCGVMQDVRRAVPVVPGSVEADDEATRGAHGWSLDG
jgi:hypothetical protein